MSKADLTQVSLLDLRALLSALEHGRIPCPLRQTGLLAVGLGNLVGGVDLLQDLDIAGTTAAVRAAIAEREHRPHIDLVWTGIDARKSTSRDTAIVMRELFASAERSVLVGGFSFDHGKEILEPLHRVMKERAVETTIFLEIEGEAENEADTTAHATRKVEKFFARNWPFGEPRPAVYYDPRTAAPGIWLSLHAKCVVVDERRCYVGSANFTDRGQTRNLEVGALVEDALFSRSLVAQWWALTESGLLSRYRG